MCVCAVHRGMCVMCNVCDVWCVMCVCAVHRGMLNSTPMDYAWGANGLDAIITQVSPHPALLGRKSNVCVCLCVCVCVYGVMMVLLVVLWGEMCGMTLV